ncbi:ABC transporter permease [Metabacillus fastidiosus]|uniref:ABC transporter permease n=1 Tax=Metabacillus fastidiosus TaxID=1458 RepID=UPI0008258F86|nr:ABC transporter permease [Metabacillus fastidiosus]MED4463539.1 ABC transporter permease [Metabacillus fastidiosus]
MIILHELKKALISPVILSLIGIFIAFNLFIIYSYSYVKEELGILTESVDQFGYELNEATMSEFKLFYDDQLKKLNKITAGTYESAAEFFNKNKMIDKEHYSKEELTFFHDVLIIENYYFVSHDIDRIYKSLNLMDEAEGQINKFQLSGAAASTVKKEFTKLSDRLEQIIKNGEHKTLFFYGKAYKMHSFLFKNIFLLIIFEILILVVLMTGFIQTYEFENKTYEHIYSTKRGRKFAFDKLIASLIASFTITTVIIGVTLISYFSFYNYSGLWNVPISSYFNSEKPIPYISWWGMSFTEYLLFLIALVYICQLFFSAITFIIATLIRNSYFTFLIFGIIFGCGLLLPSIASLDSNLIFISMLTPFSLIMNPNIWFIGGNPFYGQYYEINIVVIWTVLLFILCILNIKIFRKQNIY